MFQTSLRVRAKRLAMASFAVPVFFVAISPAFAQTAQTPQVLPVTVVTAARFDDNAATLAYGVSVITADDLAKTGVSTVNEALMKILGVAGRQDTRGGREFDLDIRGFGERSGNNQVYIVDGVNITEQDIGGTRLSSISVESIERIEVIYGSAAVLYGSGATAGAIVITTKAGSGSARENRASIHTEVGSFGTHDVRSSATLSTGDVSLDVAFSERKSDNHRDNFKSAQDSRSITGQWSGDSVRIGATYSKDALDSQLPGALSADEFAANPYQSTSANANLTGTVENEKGNVFIRAYVDNWELGVDTGSRTKVINSLTVWGPYDYVTKANSTNLRAQHKRSFVGYSNKFTVGYDLNDWRRDVTTYGDLAVQKGDGIYVQNEMNFLNGTVVSAGMRRDTSTLTESSSSTDVLRTLDAWDLGVNHQLTPEINGFGRLGTSYTMPNVDQVTFVATGATLRPQTSRDLEIGVRWANEKSKTELRAYKHELKNELAYDPTIPANTNLDPTRRQGIEFNAGHAFSKRLDVRFNASVRSAGFVDGAHAGKTVPLVPRQTIALAADWRPVAGHAFNLGLNWISSQKVNFQNECEVPSNTLLFAGYRHKVNDKLELSLGVNNLTNAKYYTLAYACSAGTASSVYPEAGRSWAAAAKLSF